MTEADTFAWLPALLVLQGLLGAIDTLYNHEIVERLPKRPEARGELAPAHQGWMSWALTLFGVSSAAWSVRDALASHRLKLRH